MQSSKSQSAIIQAQQPAPTTPEAAIASLRVSHTAAIPTPPSDQHVLVRVLAVALNPTDYKMVSSFPLPGGSVGCDFCGIVEQGTRALPSGTRVCGAVFPYQLNSSQGGAFAQWVVADQQVLLRVPDSYDDLQAAAIGGVSWGTAGLALYDPEALGLEGSPARPASGDTPVLVHGGATASGTMAIQLLKLSGYSPIAVTSTHSASLALEYGADGTAAYTSTTCVETIKSLARTRPIRYALDCIASEESVATCFAAMARTGGRYASLEGLDSSWERRRTVKVKEVMGFEGLGIALDLGPGAHSAYSRPANKELYNLTTKWTREVQALMDAGTLRPHPVREIQGGWQGILDGLDTLQAGGVRGRKLVVRVS